MSQDDPTQGDGENGPQEERPDGPKSGARDNQPHDEGLGPKAPPARPPGVPPFDPEPVKPAQPGEPPATPPRNGIRLRKKHAIPLGVLVVVIIIVVLVENLGGTASPKSPVPIVPGTNPTETETKPRPETPPPPKPTELAYPPKEITFEGGTSYNIDHRRIARERGLGEPEINGFKINTYPDPGGNVTRFEVTGQSGRVASWAGQGEADFTGCKQALDSSGLREVVLKRQGEWFCAETDKGYVAVIRYDGEQSEEPPIYEMFAKVYIPGHN